MASEDPPIRPQDYPKGLWPTTRKPRQGVATCLRVLRPRHTGHELIRLGPDGPGGYLVPNDLDGVVACFSPGVGDLSGFELACAERGMAVYLADPSVAGPAESHPGFHFTPHSIGAFDQGPMLSLESWIERCDAPDEGDWLLQMDIESGEYAALLAAPASLLRRFRIIVVEFHRLYALWSEPFFEFAASTFGKLLNSHVCAHIHPNNRRSLVTVDGIAIPPIAEFTFLRKDRARELTPVTRFPHPLDRDISTKRDPIVLPRSFYDPPGNSESPSPAPPEREVSGEPKPI